MHTSLNRDLLVSVIREQEDAFAKKELGVTREELKKVSGYTHSPHCIVISGLRRVGKSTLLAQIARRFYQNSYYYINFEDERLLSFTTPDFDILYNLFVEIFGERKVFFLDEIQNVKGWEHFVRRLTDAGFKFYLTGSNASLLSGELGTKLTGRHIPLELFPFSFSEFSLFKKLEIPRQKFPTTVEQAKTKRYFREYLKEGGIPEAIKYPQMPIHKTLYDDILYRDVATRYQIESTQALRELAFYLTSNCASLVSFNKLKELLKLGSVNTVKSYIEYLERAWLFFVVESYSYSVKKQQIAPKKIYGIDTGLIRSVGFSFSENEGKFLENLVFLALRKKSKDIFYFKSKNGSEVDFYLPKEKELIQVTKTLEDKEVIAREKRGMEESLKELGTCKSLILTEDEKGEFKIGKNTVSIKPIYQWLLEE